MLVRDVVVAVLRMEERSEAEVDVRDARDDRGVKRLGGGCGGWASTEGGGGGGARRVVAVDDEEEDVDRGVNLGEVGTDRDGGVAVCGGEPDEGDLDEFAGL